MLFTEFRFLLFFAIVWSLYWLVRSNAIRKILLLVASYAFYAGWDARFLVLIFVSTVIDWVVGRQLHQERDEAKRRRWVTTSVVVNLGILGFFKYFNFFIESAVTASAWLGLPLQAQALEIVLPVGISFFTFQSMSYTIDIHRGRTEPRGFLDFSLYVAFFPQLVAGPIVRAREFLPQLGSARRLSKVSFRWGLGLFMVGFVKKAAIADNVAPIVDAYFADPAAYDVMASWIAVTLYAVQIYCDFSGYSDMAIATAALLGYELGRNFAAPYFASSLTAFWRRWHISLSTWLRDYLYITLGGNRGGEFKTYRNLFLTMLLGGLWHGAAWTFVIWGALHGLWLIAERLMGVQAERRTGWARYVWIAVTFYVVCVFWIFFRAQSTEVAGDVFRAFVFLQSSGSLTFPTALLWWFGALAGVHALGRLPTLQRLWTTLPPLLVAAILGAGFAIAVSATPVSYRPFIYFQF